MADIVKLFIVAPLSPASKSANTAVQLQSVVFCNTLVPVSSSAALGYGSALHPDSDVVDAFNRVVKAYRTCTKNMDDDQAYKVSQQLSEFFT